MAVCCPECGRQYDVTLFEFGRRIGCECGALVDLSSGQTRRETTAENQAKHKSDNDR